MNRSAQSSLEYIFMFAVGLVIILVIVRYMFGVKGAAREAGEHINATKKDIDTDLNELKESG